MDGYAPESPSEAPSIAIIETIAAREGVDPTALQDPLHTVINPEALDSLFRSETGRVTFTYHGYEVTVSNEGCVTLQPSDNS